jgi:DNA replication protein DnaC
VARRGDPEPSCPYAVCDGSGWVLGPEDIARPCRCREQRQARARTSGVASVIPAKYRGVSFERPPVPSIFPPAVEMTRSFCSNIDSNIRDGTGMWFTGSVGTGKTTLAMLISKAAIQAGHSVIIYSLPKLLARVRRTYDENPGEDSYLELFERLTSADLLHIDDLGVEKRSDWVLEQLYALVNERYEQGRSIVVTTNLDANELQEQIGERTVSRLTEICGHNVASMFGQDLRLAS